MDFGVEAGSYRVLVRYQVIGDDLGRTSVVNFRGDSYQ